MSGVNVPVAQHALGLTGKPLQFRDIGNKHSLNVMFLEPWPFPWQPSKGPSRRHDGGWWIRRKLKAVVSSARATIELLNKLDFIYFDAGGGHRAAATALQQVIERRVSTENARPLEVRMVNLQELLDSLDLFRK